RRCVIFAGSGLSRNAGLPDWLGLAQSLQRELIANGALSSEAATTIAPYVDSPSKLSTGIGLLVEEAGRKAVTLALRRILQPTRESPVFDLIKQLRPKGIITTNFDRLLDNICSLNQ